MFSLVEELSSPAFRKIATLVSPKRGYPELPDYPTIPALPIYEGQDMQNCNFACCVVLCCVGVKLGLSR